jgi:surface protein
MSIADQITRLNNAKANIKQAIENKGVTVSDSALLDEYPALINSIPMEGGDPYYEEFYNMRTNNGTNMAGLFSYCTAPELDLSNLDVSKVTNMKYMFSNCSSSVNIDGWDTSNVTDMKYMFYRFFGSIDVSKLDASKVTNAEYMFSTTNTDKIILTGMSFPSAKSLSRMFDSATGTTLDLSSWDISNITDMSYMFSGVTHKRIDLTGWNTNKVTSMGYMFNVYSSYFQELIMPDWDMTNVTSSNNFFNTSSSYNKNLMLIDLSRSNDATITKIASYLPTRTSAAPGTVLVPANTSQEVCDTLAAKYWTAQKPEVPEEPSIPLYVPGEFENNTEVTEVRTMVDESHDDLSNMFFGCENLVSVNTEDWDTSNVTDMTSMFQDCTSLTQLDLSNFNTALVWSMGSMFYNCTSLTTLDLSNWETASIMMPDMDMFGMFDGCTSLHTLRLDNCSNDTIKAIIKLSQFPRNAISGVTRTIYCKEANAAGLEAPTNWVFSYVD